VQLESDNVLAFCVDNFMQATALDEDNEPSLLVLILDTNPVVWASRAESAARLTGQHISFGAFVEHVLVFVHAYLMLHHQNMLVILSSHTSHSEYIFPASTDHERAHSNDFSQIKRLTLERLERLMQQSAEQQQAGAILLNTSTLSSALSLALCYITPKM